MNQTPLLLALIVGLTITSCTENQPPKQEPPKADLRQNPFMQTMGQAKVTYSPNLMQPSAQPGAAFGEEQKLSLQNMAAAGAVSGAAPAAGAQRQQQQQPAKPAEPPPAIPDDARWTLYITSLTSPDRFSTMQRLKTTLMEQTPFKQWYVVHGEAESTLFHGFYSTVERASKDGAKAHAQKDAIKSWQDRAGNRPFASAFFTPITPPDPVAPAEWNLANAPEGMFWSLQVGAYQGDPRRKQYAVEAVREARARGIPAFYHHGSTVSIVTIGMWPRNALKEQEAVTAETNPERAIMVTDSTLPARYKHLQRITDREGQQVDVMAQRVDIQDPTLLAAMKEYPHNLVNGVATKRVVRGADGKPRDLISPSFLVIIPRGETGILANHGAADDVLFGGNAKSGGQGAAAGAIDPYNRNAPAGAGKLRGLK